MKIKKIISRGAERIVQGIHVVAKPISPVCNLNCDFGPLGKSAEVMDDSI